MFIKFLQMFVRSGAVWQLKSIYVSNAFLTRGARLLLFARDLQQFNFLL